MLRGPPGILSIVEEPHTHAGSVLVIYIVLFARTKVETEATKMLLIIQRKGKGVKGGSRGVEYH